MKGVQIILFFLIPFVTLGQYDPNWGYISEKQADSLRNTLTIEKNDTLIMNAYRSIGFYYGEGNLDSSLYYYQKYCNLAQKLNIKIWVADAYSQLGYCYVYLGNINAANESLLKSINIATDKKNENSNWNPSTFSNAKNNYESRIAVLALAQNGMGSLYLTIGDTAKSKEAFRKAYSLGSLINNGKIQSLALGNLSSILDADSMILYSRKAIEFANNSGYKKFICANLLQIAQGLILKTNYDSVAVYLYAAIESAKAQSNTRFECFGYYGLTFMFMQQQNIDSAIHYARILLPIAEETKIPDIRRLAYKANAEAYKLKNNTDSAFKYLESYTLINDSLTNSRLKQLTNYQHFAFDEQQRLTKINQEKTELQNRIILYSVIGGLLIIAFIALILYRNNKKQRQSNIELQKVLHNLKSTQTQLIHSAKMASLGELTAGIAHEIQNPLNFVNNFSEVSNELIDEMNEELDKGDIEEAKAIASDVKQNLEKINHHGKRAADIVKGMLQHSRSSTGQKEPTDINALCDEYLRLAYHGLRAKDKSFNAKFETDFDNTLPKINIVPQDIGRVILNLINNAFYTVSEKAKSLMPNAESYEPTVVVSTKNLQNKVEVKVKDNGNGIPEKIKDKIFQPFFTTKPTGQGTGLGLSLSYDIVKAHGGEIKVNSKENAGPPAGQARTEFIIILPCS